MKKEMKENFAFAILFLGIALVLGSMIATPIGGWNVANECHKDIYFQTFSVGILISFAGFLLIWIVNRK